MKVRVPGRTFEDILDQVIDPIHYVVHTTLAKTLFLFPGIVAFDIPKPLTRLAVKQTIIRNSTAFTTLCPSVSSKRR